MSRRFITLAAVLLPFATALSACDADTAADPGLPSASASPFPGGLVTVEWHAAARHLVAAQRLNALAAGRIYAALGVAQHQAITAVDGGMAFTVLDANFGPGGNARAQAHRGAVAGASAQVLGWFFPAAAAMLAQQVMDQGSAAPGQTHPEFTRGVQTGKTAGEAVVTRLQSDGFSTPWTGTVPTGPGLWVPNALPPGGVMLGSVTPYFMTSGAQFRPAAPPAFGSAPFDAAVDAVVSATQNRTPAQLASALYWDFPAGTPTPIGFWNGAAADYIALHNFDERAAAKVFALMHAAVFDALIGCWEAKYHYWTLRPSQANGTISLAFGVPNFPAYPSGHSCASSSAGRVLEHFFPEHAEELAELVAEAGESRVVAGIHYPFDVTAGVQLGRAVAELAIATGL